MRLEDEDILGLMEQHSVIGSDEYGGTGTNEEFVLVGMIYQHLSSSENSVARLKREDLEIFKLNSSSYIVWIEGRDIDMFAEDEEDEFEDDTSIPERIPVAIEGPFTDSEIVELVNGGSI